MRFVLRLRGGMDGHTSNNDQICPLSVERFLDLAAETKRLRAESERLDAEIRRRDAEIRRRDDEIRRRYDEIRRRNAEIRRLRATLFMLRLRNGFRSVINILHLHFLKSSYFLI